MEQPITNKLKFDGNGNIELWVGSSTNTAKLAGTIKKNHETYKDKKIMLRYIGAQAGTQAIKSVAVLNQHIYKNENRCTIAPFFVTNENNYVVVVLELLFEN